MSIVYGTGIWGEGAYGGGGPPLAGPNVSPVSQHFCTYALDPATGDVVFPLTLLRGNDAITQRLRSRLWFFAGEWFLDTRLGMPYFDQILVKNPRLPVVASLFRKAILSTPGVATCSNVSVKVDRRARIGAINFEASLDDGLTLTAVDEPFIIGVRTPVAGGLSV